MKEKFLYCPENITLETLNSFFSRKDTIKVIKFFHTLIIQKINNKVCRDSWIKLQTSILKEKLGRIDFIKSLENEGFIEIDHSYLKSHFCKSYRLTEKYRNSKWVEIIKIPYEEKRHVTKVEKHLRSWCYKLEVDFSKVPKEIDESQMLNLELISKKRWDFITCDFGNRFHSNLTRMKKELRKHLRCQNETLVQFDIKCSELYWLAILFQKIKFNLNLNDFKSVKNILLNNRLINLINLHYLPDVERNSELDKETALFTGKVISGNFYEHLIENTPNWNGTRDEFKQMFFQTTLFSKKIVGFKSGSKKESVNIENTFKKIYPNICNVIKSYNNKTFCSILQKYESNFLYSVIDYLRINNPEIPIWTIHDSFITIKSKAYELEKIINNFTNNLLLPSPKIKREDWI